MKRKEILVMATHGVIIEKKPGFLLPQELVDGALDKFPNCVGMARVHEGNLDITRLASTFDAPTFFKDQEKVKGEAVIFYFGSNSSPYMDEDLQPITLVEVEEDPVAIAFLTGEFADAPPKVSHTKEYLVVENYLQEKVSDLWDLVGMDIDKLAEALDKPGTRKEVLNTCLANKTGTITILLYNGRTITYAQNPHRVTGEWGTATESCVAQPPPKEEPAATSGVPAVSQKQLTMAEKIAAAKAAKDGTAPPPTATAVPPTAGTPAPAPATVKKKVGPAPSHLKNDQKRAWWMKNAGYIPEGYKDAKCTVTIDVVPKEATLPKSVITDALPIVPPSLKAAILEDCNDAGTEEDPDLREKSMEEFPNACAAVGYDIEKTFRWTCGKFIQMGTKYPVWMAILAYNNRNMFLREEALTESMTSPEDSEADEAAAAAAPPAPAKQLTMAEKIAAAKAAKAA